MNQELKRKHYYTQSKIEEDRYETIKTLFTISFVFSDSIMIFDLVFNYAIIQPRWFK